MINDENQIRFADSESSLNELPGNDDTDFGQEKEHLHGLRAKFKISLTWTDLTYTVSESNFIPMVISFGDNKFCQRKERIILHPQSGQLSNGCLMALIGKSGSGKSTLIESLTGRRTRGLKGKISVNVDPSVAFFVDETCIKVAFIPQADALFGTLTVTETLFFASKLRNRDFTLEQHVKIVNILINELDLNKCRNGRVLRCSGGEKKRLSVAMELVSKPNILILDEPTSGLDSASALQCIKLLRKLTQSKSNSLAIMVSIHQPSAKLLFEFHNLYLLSYNGRCIYNGSIDHLLAYFNKFNVPCPEYHNPADHALEVASGDHGSDIVDAMAECQTDFSRKAANANIDDNDYEEEAQYSISSIINAMTIHSATSLISHCSTLTVRTLKTTFRDPTLNYARFLQHVIVAFALVLVYTEEASSESGCFKPTKSNNDSTPTFSIDQLRQVRTLVFQNLGFLYFTIFFTLVASMMPIVLVIPTEMAVFIRERTNGWYSCLSYYLAKTIADMPFLLLFTTIYAIITYYLTGQVNDNWRFATFLVISILLSLMGQSIGMVVGAICVQNLRTAVFIAPLVVLPFYLFCGFYIRIPFIPKYLQFLSTLSPIRYAFEALVVTVYGFDRCAEQSPQYTEYKESVNGAVFRFFAYLTSLDLSYANARPILRMMAEAKNLSLTELDSFDIHFENFSMSNFNLMDVNENESFALQEFNLTDDNLWPYVITLAATVVVLKVLTYFLLLIKANKRD